MEKLRNKIKAAIKFVSFSIKQLKILTWWTALSPYCKWNGIIADGAIRAGKTVPMSMSFVFWAMDTFDEQNFAMCGKSIGSFKRNVWNWLRPVLTARGYEVVEVRSINFITISYRGKTNYFYIFGGKDERSQDLIQGITLAGIFFDEVALMPESFVNQGTARCSVDGSKWWFNCNPEGPMHWFKTGWVDQAKDKRILHLHFEMADNPSLSPETIAKYRAMYKGVFFQRFILGLWVMAEGAIYKDAWSSDLEFSDDDVAPGLRNNPAYRRFILVDYGTVNPMVYLDVIDDGNTWWIVDMYYYNSKITGIEKTDAQLVDDLIEFISSAGEYAIPVNAIVIDPSAASFKVELRSRSLRVREAAEEIINADNEVRDGIRRVATVLTKKKVRIHRTRCAKLIEEILSYVWDDKAIQKGMDERPLKVNDHGPDALRYGVKTLISDRRLAA